MLKLKSAFFGLCVSVQMGYGLTGSSSCRANDELLPDFVDEVRSISTGSEKGCASDLPVPGVSFPTRLYSQHAAAYGTRLISLVPVQAGFLPETDIEGCLKSEGELLTISDEIEVIARNADNEASFAVGVVSEVKASGWRAAKPQESAQGMVEFEPQRVFYDRFGVDPGRARWFCANRCLPRVSELRGSSHDDTTHASNCGG
jgi:hypothetical protein